MAEKKKPEKYPTKAYLEQIENAECYTKQQGNIMCCILE